MGIVSGGGGGAFSGGSVANSTTFHSEVTLAGNDGGNYALDVDPGNAQGGGMVINAPSGASANYQVLHINDKSNNDILNISNAGEFAFSVLSASKGFTVADAVGGNLIQGVGAGTVGLSKSGGALGFFGGSPALQQTLASGTATPEQIALALEASTLMGGT